MALSHTVNSDHFRTRNHRNSPELAFAELGTAFPQEGGVVNARLGTPMRVNVFSGIATIVVVLATKITSGDAEKYFGAVLGATISTTLISYLLIYPALWKLRVSHPEVNRPFRMPL